MLNKSIIFLIILAAAIFQLSASTNLFPVGAVPDVLLVFVTLWTVFNGFEKTLSRTIISGIMLDLIFFWPPGLNIISLSVISFLVSFLAKRFLVAQRAWKFLFLVILTIASTILLHLIYYFAFSILSFSGNFMKSEVLTVFDARIVYQIISNLIILIIVYWPIKKIENFLFFYDQSIVAHRR